MQVSEELSMWKKTICPALKEQRGRHDKGTAYFAGTFYERN